MGGAVLESIGLPEPDGSVYAAVVGNPRASAAELATECRLSASHAGRALARLAELGMVSRLAGRPVRYLAAAPDVAVGDLIGRREAELREARGAVHRLMDSYRAASQFTHPEQSVEVLVGRGDINNRVAQLHQAARIQVRGFDKPPYVSPPGHNLSGESARIQQGVRYRVIYDRQAVSWPGRLAGDIQTSLEAGEQARVRPQLPLKMLIADDRMAIIPISSAEHESAAAYVLHRSSLLDALCILFEAEWDRATPLRSRPGQAEADTPDERTHQLLTLLAAGLTDEGIARSLGYSMRTTQRRIQALLAELGATTRFQAGRNAQARGWL
jgi:DNA-binding NarL/FixJ family response regulator